MTHPKGHVTYPKVNPDDYSNVTHTTESTGGPVQGYSSHAVAHDYAKHNRVSNKDPRHSRPGMPRVRKV